MGIESIFFGNFEQLIFKIFILKVLVILKSLTIVKLLISDKIVQISTLAPLNSVSIYCLTNVTHAMLQIRINAN